ncbi:MAG: SRPBCC family protein [Caulobacterales bacterium]
MSRNAYQRSAAHYEAIVDAPVEQVWALLTDWAGLLKWWPKSEAPFVIVGSDLIGQHGEVPRGRRVTLDNGGGGVETLLLESAAAGRIYYDMVDGTIPGVFNYLATTTVDATEDGGSLMRFSSTFDVAPGIDPAILQGAITSVYQAIARGFSQNLDRR